MIITLNVIFITTIVIDKNNAIIYSKYMDYFLIEYGKKVKGFRELRGLSQEELAEMVDVSMKTISLWETGKSFIEYPTLLKLCNALEIEPGELFSFPTEKGDTPQEQIINLTAKLTPAQQIQVLNIIKTF